MIVIETIANIKKLFGNEPATLPYSGLVLEALLNDVKATLLVGLVGLSLHNASINNDLFCG